MITIQTKNQNEIRKYFFRYEKFEKLQHDFVFSQYTMGFCTLKPPSKIKINSSALWDAAGIHRLFYTWEKLESYRQTWQTKLWWTRCPCLIQCLYYTNDDMMHLINVSQGRVSCPFNIADESVCVCVSTNLIRHLLMQYT